jgi:choline dehydrogenase-like flavoprotein
MSISRHEARPVHVYCGFCERFGCGNYSKSRPQTCVLPALLRFPNFTARTESEVTKINLDGPGKRATGVTFVDTRLMRNGSSPPSSCCSVLIRCSMSA